MRLLPQTQDILSNGERLSIWDARSNIYGPLQKHSTITDALTIIPLQIRWKPQRAFPTRSLPQGFVSDPRTYQGQRCLWEDTTLWCPQGRDRHRRRTRRGHRPGEHQADPEWGQGRLQRSSHHPKEILRREDFIKTNPSMLPARGRKWERKGNCMNTMVWVLCCAQLSSTIKDCTSSLLFMIDWLTRTDLSTARCHFPFFFFSWIYIATFSSRTVMMVMCEIKEERNRWYLSIQQGVLSLFLCSIACYLPTYFNFQGSIND